jgi:hypothetical protein
MNCRTKRTVGLSVALAAVIARSVASGGCGATTRTRPNLPPPEYEEPAGMTPIAVDSGLPLAPDTGTGAR